MDEMQTEYQAPPDATYRDAPSFVHVVWADEPASRIVSLDGWSVAATGDWDLDTAVGEGLADAAVKFARKIKQPAFLLFVMGSIQRKIFHMEITPSGVEHGFARRVAQLAYCGSFN